MHTGIMELPPLPQRPDDEPYSANVKLSFDILNDAHRSCSNILRLQHPDITRININIDIIIKDVVVVLEALEESAEFEGIPLEWVQQVSECMLQLYEGLKEKKLQSRGK